MNSIRNFNLLCIVCCILLACNGTNNQKWNTDDSQITYYEERQDEGNFVWYKIEGSDGVGAKDKDGKIIIEPNTRNIVYNDPCFIVYYFFKNKDDKSIYVSELRDKKGNILISKYQGYTSFTKVEIKNSDNGFFESRMKINNTSVYGVIAYNGECIIPALYDYIYYGTDDVYDDSDDRYETFMVSLGDNNLNTYIYVDDDGNYCRFGNEFDLYYLRRLKLISTSTGKIYSGRDDSYDNSLQFIPHKRCIFNNREYKYLESSDGYKIYESIYDDDVLYIQEDNSEAQLYSKGFCIYYEICKSTSFKSNNVVLQSRMNLVSSIRSALIEEDYNLLYSLINGNNTGSEPYSNQYNNHASDQHYINNSPSVAINNDQLNRTPRRDPCRACKNTGICPVCNGSRKVVSEYSIVAGDTRYKSCTYCGGNGKCHACGGDGYLDENIDF